MQPDALAAPPRTVRSRPRGGWRSARRARRRCPRPRASSAWRAQAKVGRRRARRSACRRPWRRPPRRCARAPAPSGGRAWSARRDLAKRLEQPLNSPSCGVRTIGPRRPSEVVRVEQGAAHRHRSPSAGRAPAPRRAARARRVAAQPGADQHRAESACRRALRPADRAVDDQVGGSGAGRTTLGEQLHVAGTRRASPPAPPSSAAPGMLAADHAEQPASVLVRVDRRGRPDAAGQAGAPRRPPAPTPISTSRRSPIAPSPASASARASMRRARPSGRSRGRPSFSATPRCRSRSRSARRWRCETGMRGEPAPRAARHARRRAAASARCRTGNRPAPRRCAVLDRLLRRVAASALWRPRRCAGRSGATTRTAVRARQVRAIT